MSFISIRTFHGRSNECVEDFISSILLSFEPMKALYEDHNNVKLHLLKSNLQGRAARWASNQPTSVTSSWEKMSKALQEKYDSSWERDGRRLDAEEELRSLEQGELSLEKYIRKVSRIGDDLAALWDGVAARIFIKGIKDVNIRLHILTIGQLGNSYTLSQAIGAAKTVLRYLKEEKQKKSYESSESDDESESSESSSSGSEESSRKRRRNKRKSKKKRKPQTTTINKAETVKMVQEEVKLLSKANSPLIEYIPNVRSNPETEAPSVQVSHGDYNQPPNHYQQYPGNNGLAGSQATYSTQARSYK